MKKLSIFVIVFSVLSQAQTFDCYDTATTVSYMGTIQLKKGRAFFKNWGAPGATFGPFSAFTKGPIIDFDWGNHDFVEPVILIRKQFSAAWGERDYSYQFINSQVRSDHCVLRQ